MRCRSSQFTFARRAVGACDHIEQVIHALKGKVQGGGGPKGDLTWEIIKEFFVNYET